MRQMLIDHKLNIAKLNTLEERVRMLKKMRAYLKYNPTHDYMLCSRSFDPTDPKPANRNIVSSVEISVISKDQAERLTLQNLDSLINNCKQEIYSLRISVSALDIAIKYLCERERYIIELRYFDGMKWDDIEINFEIKFGKDKYLSIPRLKQLDNIALEAIAKVLDIN